MSKIVISVFDNERAALEALGKLQTYHTEGSVSLFANAILVKNGEGYTTVTNTTTPGGDATVTGLLIGGLIGLLAGPVGAAAGASIGGLTGLAVDADEAEVDIHLANEVADVLGRGNAALLAEVVEVANVNIAAELEALGGVYFECSRDEIAENLYAARAKAYDEELEALRDEWRQSTGAARDKAAANIAAAEGKIQQLNRDTDANIKAHRRRADVRIAVMRDQVETASEERKKQLEKRIEETRENTAARTAKLKEAWSSTQHKAEEAA